MGDRCDMEITICSVPKDKMEEFKRYFEGHFHCLDCHHSESVAGAREYSIEGINYGGYDQLRHLASLGVEFYGWHGAGCEYPAFMFATMDLEVHEALHVNDFGIVAPIDRAGNVDARHLEEIARYHRAKERLEGDSLPKMEWPK